MTIIKICSDAKDAEIAFQTYLSQYSSRTVNVYASDGMCIAFPLLEVANVSSVIREGLKGSSDVSVSVIANDFTSDVVESLRSLILSGITNKGSIDHQKQVSCLCVSLGINIGVEILNAVVEDDDRLVHDSPVNDPNNDVEMQDVFHEDKETRANSVDGCSTPEGKSLKIRIRTDLSTPMLSSSLIRKSGRVPKVKRPFTPTKKSSPTHIISGFDDVLSDNDNCHKQIQNDEQPLNFETVQNFAEDSFDDNPPVLERMVPSPETSFVAVNENIEFCALSNDHQYSRFPERASPNITSPAKNKPAILSLVPVAKQMPKRKSAQIADSKVKQWLNLDAPSPAVADESNSVDIVRGMEEEPPFNVSCKHCDKEFENGSLYCYHLLDHALDEKQIIIPSPKDREKNAEPYIEEFTKHHAKKFRCTLCGHTSNLHCNMVIHINSKVHLDYRPFPCPECDACFTAKPLLVAHFSQHVPVEEWPYVCRPCNIHFWDAKGMARHCSSSNCSSATDVGNKPTTSNAALKSSTSLGQMQPFSANLQLDLNKMHLQVTEKPAVAPSVKPEAGAQNVILHSRRKRGRPFGSCRKKKARTSMGDLEQALADVADIFQSADRKPLRHSVPSIKTKKTVENILADFVCHLCQAVAETEMEHFLHILDHDVKIESGFEDIRNEHATANSEQVETADGHILYQCKLCGYNYDTFELVAAHVASDIHLDIRLYVCSYCNERFYDKCGLAKHHLIHQPSNVWPYACGSCNERFLDLPSCQSHVKSCRTNPVQNGQSSGVLICNVCDKRCSSKSTFENHMMLHQGIRPYKCKDCDKSYPTKTSCDRHWQMNHGTVFPFYCSKCSKGFLNACYLKRHMGQRNCNGKSRNSS